jgi:hypothetical protein
LQVERARRAAGDDDAPAEGTELQRDENGEPLKLALAPAPQAAAAATGGGAAGARPARPAVPLFGGDEDGARLTAARRASCMDQACTYLAMSTAITG